MRPVLLTLCLLAGCGHATDPKASNRVAAEADAAAGREAVATAVETATLTGLYEGEGEPVRSQLCILDRGTGDSRFGFILRFRGGTCSGAGRAVRQDRVLRLDIVGDKACRIDARIEGGRVTFPVPVPAGCAYYCSASAEMTGAVFDKIGGTAQDAMRARNQAGDPLCG